MAENTTPSMLPDDAHNRRLIDHVHPSDWQNPEPADRYHLVVIGAGTAGLVSAIIAAGAGAKVALVERHLMGGDCLNVGCVPSKGVIGAARAWHAAARAHERFGAPKIADATGDFAFAMERMRKLRADISHIDGAARFRDQGIDVFLGEGRFVASDAVEVAGARLHFRRAVIATGGRASAPPIPGLDQIDYLTNETIFSLTELPRRLGVIGAGPIGSELAQAFARYGSEVHLFDLADHILPREDADAAAVVQEAMVRDGVHLHLGASIETLEKTEGETRIRFTAGGAPGTVACDALLVAVGRAPNVEGLGLEGAGVRFDPRKGIEVDDHLRTTNAKIFACGDVASRYQFTHAADAQARIVVQNALFFRRLQASKLTIPWTTYTSPEIAHVGLYAHEAEAKGIAVDTYTVPLDDVDRAKLDGEDEGFARIHVERGTDTVVGATLVAAHAGDMIGALCLVVTHGIGLGKVSSTIFPYPTQGEVVRKVADAYMRTKLTPRAKSFLSLWMRVFK